MTIRSAARATAIIIALFIGLLALFSMAQVQARDEPILTEAQRLNIQVLVKDMEIAQLKAQAASRDFEEAKLKLVALVQQLHVDGYELNIGTQSYAKVPSAEGK